MRTHSALLITRYHRRLFAYLQVIGWVQDRQGYYWSLYEVQSKLRVIMENEGRHIWQISRSKRIDVRTAAYVVALERLAKEIEAHGTQNCFAA